MHCRAGQCPLFMGAHHLLCTCSGLSDKLHLLLSLIVLSPYKVKVPFFFLQSDGLLCLAEVRACIVISALIAQQRFQSI